MIPRPQMILDRKWSPTWTANDPVKNWGMEWFLVGYWMKNGAVTQGNKRGKKGTKRKKNGINLKRIWYQPYFFLSQLFQISFRRCRNFKTGRTLRRNNSIILTPRSSTCLLRNRKPDTRWCAHYDCDALWIQNFQDGGEGWEISQVICFIIITLSSIVAHFSG